MINNFDVLKQMSERGMEIRVGGLENIASAQANKKGTLIKIGVPSNVVVGIMAGMFAGGLILANKVQFDEVKAQMEAEALEQVVIYRKFVDRWTATHSSTHDEQEGAYFARMLGDFVYTHLRKDGVAKAARAVLEYLGQNSYMVGRVTESGIAQAIRQGLEAE